VSAHQHMKDAMISFKIERTLKAKLLALAKEENRTLSNFIEKTLREAIKKSESEHRRAQSRKCADAMPEN